MEKLKTNKRTVYGVGFVGEGNYRITINCRRTKASNAWKNMLQRCYKGMHTHPSYGDCFVAEEWYNFQNFAKWFEDNYTEGWELDKDILVKTNKTYSPKTCCFVPKEVNYLFIKCDKSRGKLPIGVSLVHSKFQATIRKNRKTHNIGRFTKIEEAFQAYKIHKEIYIKEVADKWKDQIDPRVYEAMYNYKVEITD